MKITLRRLLLRILKISGISVGVIIAVLFLLPYLFPGFVSTKIRQWARHSIRSELSFSSARLSFFRHFPALTLTLHDVRLYGSAPFDHETLVDAREISLGVDISSVFSTVKIDKIFLTDAAINVQVDTGGHANYNIYVSDTAARRTTSPPDSTGASLKIKKIVIENSRLIYNDQSLPMLINIRGFNYLGSGDLSQDVFALNTHTQIESMDFYYNKLPYFLSKKVNADLVTRVNTNSLAFIFEKNVLTINQLPVEFTGQLSFLKNGYDMDFKLRSTDSSLHNMFSALPPDVIDWLSKTEVRGSADLNAVLKGKYIASSNTMPDLDLDLKITDGFIANNKAPVPVTNLRLDLHTRLPGFNTDSLKLNIDTAFFNLDKDYFNASFRMNGLRMPWIALNLRSDLDLEKWDRAFGWRPADLKGHLSIQGRAEGNYTYRIEKKPGLRKVRVDTIITSVPRFTVKSSLRNGFLKFPSLPEAISAIAFDLDASCPDPDYHHTQLRLDNLTARALGSYVKGYFRLDNAETFPVDAQLETVLHLEDLKKAYPLDSIDLAGDLSVHLQTKGNYQPARHRFPVTRADLKLSNGRVATKYYPHPLENIQVAARITNTDGSIKDLDVEVTPVSFVFEGQPFTIKADLKDFADLNYNIVSHGSIDLGRIAEVFGQKDYRVTGLVQTDLSLRGRLSDAAAGRYDQLYNKGTMRLKELVVSSELFPLSFDIHTGLFRFDQDKMWFDSFTASYGNSRFTLNGWLSDVMGYLAKKGEPLHGSFDLRSDQVFVDQLMAFAPAGGATPGALTAGPVAPGASTAGALTQSPATAGPVAPQKGGAETGVIIVPSDLAISFHADLRKIQYNGLVIDSFKGGVSIDSGTVHLDTTTFTLAGAPVEMNASYQSQSLQSARFDYHLRAKDFDVHRAYTEVKLFHDLAASAANARGIVSLEYNLAGRLDANMRPVYSSLKGGGTLSLSKVKVKGMKLFGEVSRQTNKDVNDPDLSKVDIKSAINNNIITIQRTRMKVSAFKLRIEGQTSFDGRLNLHVRVGLPPFGVIGIPVTVTGTEDKPIVKVRRGTDEDKLEETADSQ
jgi:AsmA protein